MSQRHWQIKMQFSYLRLKHPKILRTLDQLSQSNFFLESITPKQIQGPFQNANTRIAFLFADAFSVFTTLINSTKSLVIQGTQSADLIEHYCVLDVQFHFNGFNSFTTFCLHMLPQFHPSIPCLYNYSILPAPSLPPSLKFPPI